MNFEESLQNHFEESLISALLESLGEKERHSLLLNPRKITPEEFVARFPKVQKHPFIDNAFYYEKEDYGFGKSILHAQGAIYIQDASAMMVSYLLSPKRGDTCVDLCAAPGGKSIGFSFQIDQSAALVSNDFSMPRAKELSSNIERLGLGNAYVTCDEPKNLASFYGPIFDNVILDAPCSGSAMFRKNDLAKKDWTFEKVLSCASLQGNLLQNAYDLLKPGGRLIYSTCSFSYEENEGNIHRFLEKHPDMEMVPLPSSSLFYRPDSLPESIYLLPHLFPGEGQFIALLVKKEVTPLNQSKYRLPKIENNRDIHQLLDDFGVDSPYPILYKNAYYHLPSPFLFPASAIRVGVKVKEKEEFAPDYALSHYLSADHSIALSLDQAKAYLKGDTFPLTGPDGFHPVSYLGIILGFCKIVKGIAKNHYPKGLRKVYSDIDY